MPRHEELKTERDRSADGFKNNLESTFLANFGWFWAIIMAVGPFHRWANRKIIDRASRRTRTRPSPYGSRPNSGQPENSIQTYPSWDLLTDRGWFSRHLPPSTSENAPDEPPIERVEHLWRVQDEEPTISPKSSVLFMSFAQWFTDGFLMTDSSDRRRTHSSHHIDFSPLYGGAPSETAALREFSESPGRKGRLKSEIRQNEEYPPRYFDDSGNVDSAFEALRPPLRLNGFLAEIQDVEFRDQVKREILAIGGERANTTPYTAALTTLFLREHNRIAGVIEQSNPEFDDERVFQISRNTTTAILLRIVVEDYVNHIAPYHLKLLADPSVAWNAVWNKPNWIPVEFNLLYRWHSLCPDFYDLTDPPTPGDRLLFNNELMTSIGLAETLTRASLQPAWRIGLFNTPEFLIGVEKASLLQARQHNIASYNDYREAYGYGRVTRFDQINGDPRVQEALEDLYKTPDRVEFFVGLFAEEVSPNSALPPLIGRMVALDAFSLALTNPLLSEHVWPQEETFTAEGRKIIASSPSLQAVADRNMAGGEQCRASMTYL